MDFDLFFSSPRWRVLEILAKKPSSPVEISQKINTSVAYVSQQLKLLEAANLITKKRTGFSEKGRPRIIFSLSREILQLNVLMNKLPARKIIQLTDYHKLVLRIWLLEDLDLHYYLEKFYWKIEDDLNDVKGIFVDISLPKPKILVVSDFKKLKFKIDLFLKEIDGKIDISFVHNLDLKKFSPENLHTIYDPKLLLLNEELKGGHVE